MRRIFVLSLVTLIVVSPMLLMGAVCSRAIDIPIVVTANLPNKDSRGPFELDLDAALRSAGIKPQGGLIPSGVPASITLTHRDKFDLRKEQQIQELGPRIHSIYINNISVEANQNSISISLPAIEVGVTNLPNDSAIPTADKYVKVAVFSGIPAQDIGSLPAPTWEQDGLRSIKDSLLKFALAVQLKTTVKLRAGDPWPKGKIRLRVKFQFAFVLKPI